MAPNVNARLIPSIFFINDEMLLTRYTTINNTKTLQQVTIMADMSTHSRTWHHLRHFIMKLNS